MKKFVVKRSTTRAKLKPIYEQQDDSSDEEESKRASAAALSGLLRKKKKKIKSKFKSSLTKVKKNAAWIKPPDPPVLWNYIDPADTPPDGYFPVLRNHAACTLVNVIKVNANSDEEAEEDQLLTDKKTYTHQVLVDMLRDLEEKYWTRSLRSKVPESSEWKTNFTSMVRNLTT